MISTALNPRSRFEHSARGIFTVRQFFECFPAAVPAIPTTQKISTHAGTITIRLSILKPMQRPLDY
jgi:hypothetical protein